MTKVEKSCFYKILFPSVVEVLFLQLFSLIDNIMVGHIPNSTLAVAALSLCHAPMNLVICVTAAFFIGTTAAVARNFGAGDMKEVRNTATQTMILSGAVGLTMSLIAYFFADKIMYFVCGTADAYPIAAMYYRINALGYFTQIVTMNITAAFRGIGETKIPMIYNLVGNGTNVVLNYILIYGKLGFEPMNAKGAAIATVISKVILLLIALPVWLLKDSEIRPQKDISLKPCPSLKKLVLPIGLTSAGEQFILQSGATLTSKIIAVLPTADIAACQVVSVVESIAWSTGDACCTASTSLFGRSLGEGREDKAKSYLRLISKWALGFAAAEMLLFCLGGRELARLFSNDSSLYDEIAKLMIVAAVSLPFINMHKTISGSLRSAGDSIAPLLSSLISLWIFRVGLGYLMISVWNMDVFAYKWSVNIDQIVRMTAMLIFYLTGHWKKFYQKSRK